MELLRSHLRRPFLQKASWAIVLTIVGGTHPTKSTTLVGEGNDAEGIMFHGTVSSAHWRKLLEEPEEELLAVAEGGQDDARGHASQQAGWAAVIEALQDPASELDKWLIPLGLRQYTKRLEEAGYGHVRVLADLANSEPRLLAWIGITNPEHRKKLLLEASKLKRAPPSAPRPPAPHKAPMLTLALTQAELKASATRNKGDGWGQHTSGTGYATAHASNTKLFDNRHRRQTRSTGDGYEGETRRRQGSSAGRAYEGDNRRRRVAKGEGYGGGGERRRRVAKGEGYGQGGDRRRRVSKGGAHGQGGTLRRRVSKGGGYGEGRERRRRVSKGGAYGEKGTRRRRVSKGGGHGEGKERRRRVAKGRGNGSGERRRRVARGHSRGAVHRGDNDREDKQRKQQKTINGGDHGQKHKKPEPGFLVRLAKIAGTDLLFAAAAALAIVAAVCCWSFGKKKEQDTKATQTLAPPSVSPESVLIHVPAPAPALTPAPGSALMWQAPPRAANPALDVLLRDGAPPRLRGECGDSSCPFETAGKHCPASQRWSQNRRMQKNVNAEPIPAGVTVEWPPR